MLNKFEQLLADKEQLILDGAMGTMLMQAGLTDGNPPEEWNVTQPDRIRALHASYIGSGSDVILTNSFGGTGFRLKLHNMQDRVVELNAAAANNARAAADAFVRPVLVAGSIGPSGELIEPMGNVSFDQWVEGFAEQARGLKIGGVDIFWIETMSDLREVEAAVQGIRLVSDLPICATLSFDTAGHTMMGVSPEKAS